MNSILRRLGLRGTTVALMGTIWLGRGDVARGASQPIIDLLGEQAKLRASDAAGGDAFGAALALSGDTLIAGARFDNVNGNSSGSAYVYLRQGSVWEFQQELVPADGTALDTFGNAVAVQGDFVAVAASSDPLAIS
jgi:hypothetical protein